MYFTDQFRAFSALLVWRMALGVQLNHETPFHTEESFNDTSWGEEVSTDQCESPARDSNIIVYNTLHGVFAQFAGQTAKTIEQGSKGLGQEGKQQHTSQPVRAQQHQ
jgi:hypothetical protein